MDIAFNSGLEDHNLPLLSLEKLKHWCAYQERCQQEVRDKAYAMKLWPEAVETIISQLIQEDFLNEERFARAFARGKFRIKKWGRIKIRAELKQRRISDYCIQRGMQEIDEEDYIRALQKLLETKAAQIKEPNPVRKQYKLLLYAASKGYEKDIVADILKSETGL